MVAKVIPAVEARTHFGEIMAKSFKKGERFIVEKSGIPMVVILNADEYAKMVVEKEERFKILDEIKGRLPEASPQEIEKDVAKAVSAVRKQHA